MLSEIQLKNYKSYHQETALGFCPVTVLCGANNSGKSALIKSILMLKQSFEAAGGNYLLLNGGYCNNGLYNDIVFSSKDKTQEDESILFSVLFFISNESLDTYYSPPLSNSQTIKNAFGIIKNKILKMLKNGNNINFSDSDPYAEINISFETGTITESPFKQYLAKVLFEPDLKKKSIDAII